jgi:hypothetical protein
MLAARARALPWRFRNRAVFSAVTAAVVPMPWQQAAPHAEA